MATTRTNGKKHDGYSLALVVDMWVGIAAMLAMAVCVLAQYLRSPDPAVGSLLTHHVQDLLTLGFVFWTVSWLVLRIALVSPLEDIFAHLYRIGGGDRTPIKMRVRVREIQHMEESINVMLWRLNEVSDDDRFRKAHDIASEARALLDDASQNPSNTNTARKVDDLLEQLQMVLRQGIQNRTLRSERASRHREIKAGVHE